MHDVLAVQILKARANLMHEPLGNWLAQAPFFGQVGLEVTSATELKDQVVILFGFYRIIEPHNVLMVQNR